MAKEVVVTREGYNKLEQELESVRKLPTRSRSPAAMAI